MVVGIQVVYILAVGIHAVYILAVGIHAVYILAVGIQAVYILAVGIHVVYILAVGIYVVYILAVGIQVGNWWVVDNRFVVGNMLVVALDNMVFVVGKSEGCIEAVVLMLNVPVVYKLGPDLILEGMK